MHLRSSLPVSVRSVGRLALFALASFGAALAVSLGGPAVTPYVAFAAIGLTMWLKDAGQEEHGWRYASIMVAAGAAAGLLVPGAWPCSWRLGVARCSCRPSSNSWARRCGGRRWRAALAGEVRGTGIARLGPLIYQRIPGYLRRWELDLGPLRVMLHRYEAADPMAEKHSHPWLVGFFLVFRGSYVEETLSGRRLVKWFNLVARDTFHRIAEVSRTPTWSLGVCLGDSNEWGFWSPAAGYRDWREVLR